MYYMYHLLLYNKEWRTLLIVLSGQQIRMASVLLGSIYSCVPDIVRCKTVVPPKAPTCLRDQGDFGRVKIDGNITLWN